MTYPEYVAVGRAFRRIASAICVGLCSLLIAVLPTAPASAADSLDAAAIGDSVMLGAKWILEKRGVDIVDAKVSRQAVTGPGLLEERGDRLPTYVVVHLGTNGTYTLEQCTDLVKTAGPDRTVFLVTIKVPRKWEEVNNAMLRDCATKFRGDRVKLLDWNAVASARPELLYADGVHLRPEGAKAFAKLITRAVTAAKRQDQTKESGVLAAQVR